MDFWSTTISIALIIIGMGIIWVFLKMGDD